MFVLSDLHALQDLLDILALLGFFFVRHASGTCTGSSVQDFV